MLTTNLTSRAYLSSLLILATCFIVQAEVKDDDYSEIRTEGNSEEEVFIGPPPSGIFDSYYVEIPKPERMPTVLNSIASASYKLGVSNLIIPLSLLSWLYLN